MDQIINQAIRFANQVGNSAASFNRETWIMITACLLISGFLLLRGSVNR